MTAKEAAAAAKSIVDRATAPAPPSAPVATDEGRSLIPMAVALVVALAALLLVRRLRSAE
ncbi:hypothetical protein CQY22_006450 [Mycolicibacterium brumae]|uniref:Nucleoid-structuring protein H-NS n=1 Tax=Mycolicibacterium brumae TaxID=85968 RepID=A0A2G5PDE5_9MYCO|nr:hypothetical protein CQY22_006450 [Mycolicibacterium brumae]